MHHDEKVYENAMALTCDWNEILREAVPKIIGEVADYAGAVCRPSTADVRWSGGSCEAKYEVRL